MKKELTGLTLSELNHYLSFFIVEVRNQKGGEYRPNTLYEIIISIQHYLRQKGNFVRFLDDEEFQGLRSVLDSKMKNLSKQGLGIKRVQADVISESQEYYLWENGYLGDDTPQKLLDTLIFSFGLHFALRAGQEHRNLRIGQYSQLSIKTDQNNKKYIQYYEDVSKANRGGLNHRKIEPKITRAYENKSEQKKCPVRLYEKYMSVRPFPSRTDAFYLKPKKSFSAESVWFCDIPVGVHTLQTTIKRLCQSAGFEGNFTNHSLRATAATRLYLAGMDEQLISEKTGHRSSAIRAYKRTSACQEYELNNIITGAKKQKTTTPVEENTPLHKEVTNFKADIEDSLRPQREKGKSGESREICIKSEDISINIKF